MFLYYFLVLVNLSMVIGEDSIVYPCLTPNEETGYCISLFSCPVLQKSLGSSTPSAIKFVRKSICAKWALKDLRVCCGKLGNFAELKNVSSNVTLQNNIQQVSTTEVSVTTENVSKSISIPDKQAHRDYVIKKLLPTITYCGLQHVDDRFYNNTETALDEFPWLVHVIFSDEEVDGEDTEEFGDRCNGVLINRRYVLTNGYCARNPVKVRLGQYNTNKSVVCIEDPLFPECTEPTIEVRIEKQILRVDNPDLDPWYNFALFRLAKNVSYTDFIRPICLPLHDPRKDVEHEQLLFTGWGAADQKGVVKKRLTYNTTIAEECDKFRAKDAILQDIYINATLVCLAPQEGVTDLACVGDEGSPLMYSYNFQWFVDSVITKVFTEIGKDCANDMPIDGIKLTPDAVEWILDNIDP